METQSRQKNRTDLNFWNWLWFGTGGKSGISRVSSPWIIVDLAIGFVLIKEIPNPELLDVSKSILIPLAAGIFAVAVTWAANIAAIGMSRKLERLAKANIGGMPNYIYPFQLGMLILLSTITVWSLISVKVIKLNYDSGASSLDVVFSVIVLATLPFSLRTTWKIIGLVCKNIIALSKFE